MEEVVPGEGRLEKRGGGDTEGVDGRVRNEPGSQTPRAGCAGTWG